MNNRTDLQYKAMETTVFILAIGLLGSWLVLLFSSSLASRGFG